MSVHPNYSARCAEIRTNDAFKAHCGPTPKDYDGDILCHTCCHFSPDVGRINPERFCLNPLSTYFDQPRQASDTSEWWRHGSRFKREYMDVDRDF